MKKILFLGAGSKADPPFNSIIDKKYFNDKGISVVDTAIESCHSCYDLMSRYSRELQSFVENGHRVVGVLEGGLLFALPSIQATQTTYPIISCPFDLVSYQAFMVPSGNGVVGSVGIDRKSGDIYESNERRKAILTAENILNLDESAVAIRTKQNMKSEIQKELERLAITTEKNSKLILNFNCQPSVVRGEEIQIWADPRENLFNGSYLECAERTISGVSNTVQVRGKSNLVIYAAKILSLNRADLREKLKNMGEEKRKSYPERDLIQELGSGD
jgi:phosphoribosylcarboxyaminoimidazole (NCAIR) mutase